LQETVDIERRESAPSPIAFIREHRGEATLLAIITAILIASVLWHPSDDGGIVLCAFRQLTGLPCMGCGLTRSFCALAKGDVWRAFAFHTLGPALFAAACVYWVRGVAYFAGYRAAVARVDGAVHGWHLPLVALVLLVVVWVVALVTLGIEGHLGTLVRQGLLYRIVTKS
jgi:hypothetical protein